MRHIIFAILMVAAILVPALVYNDGWFQNSEKPDSTFSVPVARNPPNYSGTYLTPAANLSPENLSGNQLSPPSAANFVAYPISTVPVAPPSLSSNTNPAQMSLWDSIEPGGMTAPMTRVGMPPTSNSVLGQPAVGLPGNQTVILPGNASGPDLSALPMEFMPVNNLAEIIRFDVDPSWVKSRWQRISTSPGEYGLSGFRVPLVTGVNPTDLHGALTYYFDAKQMAQKITFRGWTGDATGLVRLLESKFKLKRQPTNWAGLYVAKTFMKKPTAALLLQYPNVIRSESPDEQLAIMLEVNNPQGRFSLSDEIKSFILISQETK